MQGYSKGNIGRLMTVHFSRKVEACKQGYTKGTMGSFMTVYYID
jgi:uncharacterized protein (DUF3820 family)